MTLGEVLCTHVLSGGTGAVDWTDEKRRRIFFLREGRIELIQSNLRSDSAERITQQHSPTGKTDDPAALAQAVARARIAAAMRETAGEARWVPNQPAPRSEPADFPDALWEIGAPRPPIHAYLAVVGAGATWFNRQPIPTGLAQYLGDLDGTRTLDEVLSFAPSSPEATEKWIRLGLVIGALTDLGVESSAYEVRSVKGKRSWGGGVDDIASMIADGIGDRGTVSPSTPNANPLTAKLEQVQQRIADAEDFFGVLGVTWRDEPETLRRAYFTLARDLHPDRFTDQSETNQQSAAELFDKVRAAWETLGDQGKRAAYIARVIHGEKTEEERAMEKVRAILDAESDFKRALSDFYAGRLTQAHELFVRCAQSVPEEAEFVAYAGYTTWRINTGRDEVKAQEGANELMAAVQSSERLDAGWVLVGLMQRAQGNDVAARQSFVTALKLKPSNPDALREMKRLEAKKGTAPSDEGGFFSRFFGKKK